MRDQQRSVMVALVCGLILFLITFGLIARLWQLQIRQGDYFSQRSQQNYTRTQTVPAPRGALYDSLGHCIARDRITFTVQWCGAGRRQVSDKHTDVMAALTQLAGNNVAAVVRKAERWRMRKTVAKKLSFDQVTALLCLPGAREVLLAQEGYVREYPFGSVAAHVLGSMSKLQQTGSSGLEARCQEQLQGTPGVVRARVNARGVPIEREVITPPVAGDSLALTIDMRLQQIASVLFEKDQVGACVLMEAESGAIRALTSYPEYDPSLFVKTLSHQEWQEQTAGNQPFLNRACMAVYPPASLFKIVTYAAGLECGVVVPGQSIDCAGSVTLGGHKYWCIRRWGHGSIRLKKAFAVSCNCACYEIAKKLSIDELAEYAYRCGIGRTAGIVLPEKQGLMPTAQWKAYHKGERWWQGETLTCGIGQSYVLTTPLQIARMVGGVSTGALVRPRLLASEPVMHEPLLLSEQTRQFLRGAMQEVVRQGSARMLDELEDFTIYAKTGTAQTTRIAKQSAQRKDQEHAWLACSFTYRNEVPMVLVVLIEHMGSARPAVVYAQRFLQMYALLRRSHQHATLQNSF